MLEKTVENMVDNYKTPTNQFRIFTQDIGDWAQIVIFWQFL